MGTRYASTAHFKVPSHTIQEFQPFASRLSIDSLTSPFLAWACRHALGSTSLRVTLDRTQTWRGSLFSSVKLLPLTTANPLYSMFIVYRPAGTTVCASESSSTREHLRLTASNASAENMNTTRSEPSSTPDTNSSVSGRFSSAINESLATVSWPPP